MIIAPTAELLNSRSRLGVATAWKSAHSVFGNEMTSTRRAPGEAASAGVAPDAATASAATPTTIATSTPAPNRTPLPAAHQALLGSGSGWVLGP